MYRLFILFLCVISSDVAIGQIVNIPDANFKTALLNNFPTIDTNNDGEIQVSEALAATDITAVAQNIVNLQGIEEFLNLETLVCFNNPITSVDLSSNTQLLQIIFTFADLTEIDLEANTQLLSVSLGNTSISQIDVSQLSDLELLDVRSTNISTLDVTNNPELLSLSVSFTGVNSLDLSNNTALESLGIQSTGISSFDFSTVPNLKIVSISDTNFTEADFSDNPQLCSLSARDCSLLGSINIQNGNNQALAQNQNCSVVLTIGGSSATSGLFANSGSPNIDFICVDDIQFATDNFTLVPPQTQFVEDCSLLSVDSFSTQDIVLQSNPVLESLNLVSKKNINYIDVFTITGQQVLHKAMNTGDVQINVEHLTAGLYFLSVATFEGRTKTFKFLKK